jgi:predicted RNA-binding Zn-ribbon protein involved in translation (DUF1610 family)
MADGIDMPCPKCGKQIVEPWSALDADSNLTCSGCGAILDFKEIKRKIEESVKKARFDITTNVKFKF